MSGDDGTEMNDPLPQEETLFEAARQRPEAFRRADPVLGRSHIPDRDRRPARDVRSTANLVKLGMDTKQVGSKPSVNPSPLPNIARDYTCHNQASCYFPAKFPVRPFRVPWPVIRTGMVWLIAGGIGTLKYESCRQHKAACRFLRQFAFPARGFLLQESAQRLPAGKRAFCALHPTQPSLGHEKQKSASSVRG
jgi:hypothetical protein